MSPLNKLECMIALLVMSTLVLLGGAMPTVKGITPTSSDGLFSDYCMTPQYFGRSLGGYGMFEAYCARTNGGAYYGADLAVSKIDLNDCLLNSNGNLTQYIYGAAMQSCTCEQGRNACVGCASTYMACTCPDDSGANVSTAFDIGKFKTQRGL